MYTYFIQSEIGPIKIGISKYIKGRVSNLQSASAFKLKCIGYLEGNKEKELHNKFSQYRLSGEWFENNKIIIRWISKNAKNWQPYEQKNQKIRNILIKNYINSYKKYLKKRVNKIWDFENDDVYIPFENILYESDFEKCKTIYNYYKAQEMSFWRFHTLFSWGIVENIHECGCDYHVFNEAMHMFASSSIIDEFGIEQDENTIYITTKYINSIAKEKECFYFLPAIADILDGINWHLHGIVVGKNIDLMEVDFFWMKFIKNPYSITKKEMEYIRLEKKEFIDGK